MWTSSVHPPATALPFPFLCPYLRPPFPPAHACAPHPPPSPPCPPPFPPSPPPLPPSPSLCAPLAPACPCASPALPFPPACTPRAPPFPPAHGGALPCLHPLLSLLCTPPFSPSHVRMSPSGAVPMS